MGSSREVSPAAVFNVVVALVALVNLFFHATWMAPNHDNSWLLLVVERLWAGETLYRDLQEINFPITYLYYLPGFLLSHFSGLHYYLGLRIFTSLLVVLSALFARRWLMAIMAPVGQWQALGLGFAVVLVLGVLPLFDFAQREHFVLLLSFPVLSWFAAREAGHADARIAPSLWATALGALGLMAKPHMLLVPLGLLFMRCGRQRSWRPLWEPQVLLFLGLAVLHAVVMVLLFRPWFDLAAMVRDIYFAYDFEFNALLAVVYFHMSAALMVVMLGTLAPLERAQRVALGVIGGIVWLFSLVMLWQMKGFVYHAYPIKAMLLLSISLLAMLVWRQRRGAWRNRGVSAAAGGLLLVFLWVTGVEEVRVLRGHSLATYLNSGFSRLLAGLPVQGPLLVLNTSMTPPFPFLQMQGVEWASQSGMQTLVPGVVQLFHGTPEQRAKGERYRRLAIDYVVQDLDRYQPEHVIVVGGPGQMALGQGIDLLAFYLGGEAFRERWRHYREVGTVEHYRVFRRQEAWERPAGGGVPQGRAER